MTQLLTRDNNLHTDPIDNRDHLVAAVVVEDRIGYGLAGVVKVSVVGWGSGWGGFGGGDGVGGVRGDVEDEMGLVGVDGGACPGGDERFASWVQRLVVKGVSDGAGDRSRGERKKSV